MGFNNAINANQQGVPYISTAGAISGIDASSSTYVLTSNGTGVAPSFQSAPGSGIVTIDGDVGSASGSAVTFSGLNQSGSTCTFQAGSALVDLCVSDTNGNTILGVNAGNLSLTGLGNSGFGSGVLASLAGSGSYNSALGFNAGSGLTTSETDCICIGHEANGSTGVSNQLNIGGGTGTGSGQLNTAYICGIQSQAITGAPVGITTGDQLGYIDPTSNVGYVMTSNGDGTASFQAASGIITLDGDTGTATGNTVTISAGVSTVVCGKSVAFTGDGSSTVNLTVTDNNSNTILGNSAGSALTGSFVNNTVFGDASLGNATGAVSFNTVIGTQSAQAWMTTESSNIVLGAGVAGVAGDNNILRIGNATGTADGNINTSYICGIQSQAISGAPVGITTGDQIGYIDPTSNVGYVMTSNGDGTASFQAASGGGITTLNGDVGSATGSTVTLTAAASAGPTVVFTGSSATMTLTVDDANGNMLIGTNVGGAVSLAGFGTNTCIGTNILSSGAATFPVNNTILGWGSFINATEATTNTICGASSGVAMIDAVANTILGYDCAPLIDHGTNNVILGDTSALLLAGGTFNLSGGSQSLQGLTSGSYNVSLGALSGGNLASSESSNIMIGYNTLGVATQSNALHIGAGTGTSSGQLNKAFISGITGIVITGAPILISSSDQLGVAASSIRYKEAVEDMSDNSSAIMQLRPVTFKWKEGVFSEPSPIERQYGLIAEEVAAIFPYLAAYDKEGNPFSVKYHELPAILLNELQKSNKIIQDLSSRVTALESKK